MENSTDFKTREIKDGEKVYLMGGPVTRLTVLSSTKEAVTLDFGGDFMCSKSSVRVISNEDEMNSICMLKEE